MNSLKPHIKLYLTSIYCSLPIEKIKFHKLKRDGGGVDFGAPGKTNRSPCARQHWKTHGLNNLSFNYFNENDKINVRKIRIAVSNKYATVTKNHTLYNFAWKKSPIYL